MNAFLFVIFLFCNLVTVLICRYAYGKPWEYSQGMLFGVHIPATELHQKEVDGLCKTARNRWKTFQNVNLILGIGICFICFADFEIFLLIFTLWIIQYVAGIYYLIVGTHRRMYALKIRNHWVDERSKRTVRTDMGVCEPGKKEISVRMHLLVLLLILIFGSKVLCTSNPVDEAYTGWIFWGVTAGLSLVFLGFHRWIMKKSSVMYCEPEEEKQKLNQRARRAWSAGIFRADMMNAAAGLAFLLFWSMQKAVWGVVFYSVLELSAVVFLLVPVLRENSRRRAFLVADPGWHDTDDDEYWKNGWYSNPDDPRLLVQDRLSSTNFTFNMARPAAKVICVILTAVVAATLIGTLAILFAFQNARTQFLAEGDSYSFSSVWYHSEFQSSDIEEIRLIDQLPEESFTKVNGGAADEYCIGHFRGQESGKCMMYLKNDAAPVLEIRLKDEVIFANSTDPCETQEWYETITGSL